MSKSIWVSGAVPRYALRRVGTLHMDEYDPCTTKNGYVNLFSWKFFQNQILDHETRYFVKKRSDIISLGESYETQRSLLRGCFSLR